MGFKIESIKLYSMKNGFNHRKIISVTTMFIALLLLVSAYGCRTSKSVTEKSKENFKKSELKIDKFDSVSKILKTNKITNFDSIGWSNYMQNIDVSYSGKTLNDKLILKFSDNTIEVSGIGDINFNQKKNKGDSINNKNQTENINEQINVNSNSEVKIKVEEEKSKIDKDKENKSAGFNWNFTILLVIIGLATLILFWKFGLPKFKKR